MKQTASSMVGWRGRGGVIREALFGWKCDIKRKVDVGIVLLITTPQSAKTVRLSIPETSHVTDLRSQVTARLAAIQAMLEKGTQGKWYQGTAGLEGVVAFSGDDIQYARSNIIPAFLEVIRVLNAWPCPDNNCGMPSCKNASAILAKFLADTEGMV